METFRIAVGHVHNVQPGNIVGALANEAGLDSENIGRVDIHEDYSLVDLPEGMPKKIFRDLQKVWVCGQQLQISRLGEAEVAKQAPRVFAAKREFSKPREFTPKSKFAGAKSDGPRKFDARPGARSGSGKPAHGGGKPHFGKPPSKGKPRF